MFELNAWLIVFFFILTWPCFEVISTRCTILFGDVEDGWWSCFVHPWTLLANPPECPHRVWSRNDREGCSDPVYDLIVPNSLLTGTDMRLDCFILLKLKMWLLEDWKFLEFWHIWVELRAQANFSAPNFQACARSPRWTTGCSFCSVNSAAAVMQHLDQRSPSELLPLRALRVASSKERDWFLPSRSESLQ